MNHTIKDVAIRAGVSVSTVSRTLNKSGYVSSKTEKKVLRAVNELGFSPNVLAVGLSRNRMNTIGVIVPDICNSFFSEVFYGACKEAELNDYRLMLCNTDDSIQLESRAIQDMISYSVSGILITPVSDEDTTNVELIRQAKQAGIPIVFVDREMRGVDCDGVYVDNIRSSYAATALLLEQGHRDIAIIAGPQDTIPGRERMKGFLMAMEEYGLKPSPAHILHADFKSESSFRQVSELLLSGNAPTAFFSCNNMMTLGCLKAFLSLGKKCPEDYALVGFDHPDNLDLIGYKLTTVHRATTEMGKNAVRMILNRLQEDEPSPCQRIILQSQLQIRGSERFIR